MPQYVSDEFYGTESYVESEKGFIKRLFSWFFEDEGSGEVVKEW